MSLVYTSGRWPVLAERLPHSKVATGAVVVVGAALTAACAQAACPILGSPVPVTGQTFAVLMTGAALGPARGTMSQLRCVAAGVLGGPVSGHRRGTRVLLGPTGGYLVGFILAAMLAGWGSRRGRERNAVSEVLVLAGAPATIYLCGAGWIAWRLHVGVGAAVSLGVTPFLLGDVLKALVAKELLPAGWRVVHRIESGAAQ